MSAPVVVLAGGTGGAKLARGMLDVVGPAELVVIANTADDIEIYGAYVSPDPDLVTFWLADRIDERGWGLAGDTFHTMEGLRELGLEVWFNLGDRDLAIGIERARMLRAGARLTEAQQALARVLGVGARVLPMSDQPVRTRVTAQDRVWGLQEFMIRGAGRGPIQDLDVHGLRYARPSPEVMGVIGEARAIVIGPSNPAISIGPILGLPGLRSALEQAAAPVVAVSPLVDGSVIKGPTEPFMQWLSQPLSSDGIASIYDGLIDGLIADERSETVPTLETNVLMDTPAARARVAADTLRFALGLAGH
ncbi:MAG TPA: 2-phospho-L-lactate transferase [Solirubrobacteraceae bacterium]|nr:2-phospho-L-lactate transferase [Solirubrobacteraceae bacterium]